MMPLFCNGSAFGVWLFMFSLQVVALAVDRVACLYPPKAC